MTMLTRYFLDALERVMCTFFEVLLAFALLILAFGVSEGSPDGALEFGFFGCVVAVTAAGFTLIKVWGARLFGDSNSASLVDERDIQVFPRARVPAGQRNNAETPAADATGVE
jgi:hypothetical protein